MSRAAVLVILPAYNEAANIARTIGSVRAALPEADICVINDGSRDDTAALARQAGAIVLELPYNVGIGAGVQTGFLYAAQQGYTLVARNDGDGQHSAGDLRQMVERLQQGDVDWVTGSRFLPGGADYGTPPARRIGIIILSRLLSSATGQAVSDPTSGFAAFNQRAIAYFAQRYPHDYPEPEAIVLAHRAGLRRAEHPVTMHKRQGGRSSITPIRSLYYMVKVTLAILLHLLRAPD